MPEDCLDIQRHIGVTINTTIIIVAMLTILRIIIIITTTTTITSVTVGINTRATIDVEAAVAIIAAVDHVTLPASKLQRPVLRSSAARAIVQLVTIDRTSSTVSIQTAMVRRQLRHESAANVNIAALAPKTLVCLDCHRSTMKTNRDLHF